MKRNAVRLIAACLAFCAGQAGAQSVSFTIDPSTSELSVNVGSVVSESTPLQGTLVGNYDPFAASLTFSGGSTIQAAPVMVQAPLLPTQFTAPFTTVDLTSGSMLVDFTGASFDIIAGTALDGTAASALTWSGSGGAL